MNSQLLVNVPDPTDFPPPADAPGLRELDASLRCNICHELYDGPVSLNCGHSFCSYCVRVSLAIKQECPTCRKTAIEGHIKPNAVIEDVVHSWKLSRSYILGLIKALNEQKHAERRRGSPPATPKAKKRKLATGTDGNGEVSSSTGSLRTPLKPKPIKQSSSDLLGATIPTSDIGEDELSDPPCANKEPRPDDLVDCPLCSRRVKFKNINQHMDNECKDSPPVSNSARSTAADWQKLMGKLSKGKQKDSDDDDEYPLPKASYGTLKDKQLKGMLIEYGLPTTGDRNQWIQRHQQWVITYNANLNKSSKHRKSKEELKRELKKWEEEKPKKRKMIVEDTVAHEKQHKSEFARLVEAARPRKAEGALTDRGNGSLLSKNPPSAGKQPTKMPGRLGAEENAIVVDSEEEELSPIQRA
ncbi:hypothetical protein C0995_006905 [Termitomyces sp. Mi166|nr:hypothetical protein C0995_006905 [Termitomyces sp. Mi166\